MPSTRTAEQSKPVPNVGPIRLSLVIPTLNEAGNIERMLRTMDELLRKAGNIEFEIIVVDDNSPDGTGKIADAVAAEMPNRVQVIHRQGKASLGTAALAGWHAGSGDVLALMDADFQHPPELITRLVDAIRQGADIAIGSRYTDGGLMSKDWSFIRKLLSQSLTGFTRLLLGPALKDVHDPMSGCFAMKRSVIAGKQLNPEGFKVLLAVLATGDYECVREVPFSFSARTAGESKLRLGVVFDDFLLLVRLAWQTRRKRSR